MATQKPHPHADEGTQDFEETAQFDMSTMPMGLDVFMSENINLNEDHQHEVDKQAAQQAAEPKKPA